MQIPHELLYTFAQSAVAYAGLSALALVVVQLAGAKWQSQMTTGFWLVIAWSLGAFVFSLMPVVLEQFELGIPFAMSFSSVWLGLFIAAVITGALRRDTRILRSGVEGPAKPPVLTMIAVGTASYGTAVLLMANALSWLPGSPVAWYLAALLEVCVFAIIPLVHLVAAVHMEE